MYVVKLVDLLEEDFPHLKALGKRDLTLRVDSGYANNGLRVLAYERERISGVSVPMRGLFHRRMP